MLDTSYHEYLDRVPEDGNGGTETAVPIIYTELEKRLKPSERKELIRQFGRTKEIPFVLKDQHPILQTYVSLLGEFVDAKPQVIITPLLSAMAANIGNKAFIYSFSQPVYCNIWTLILGPSSISRKTTSIRRTLGPLDDLDQEFEKQYQQELIEYKRTPTEEQGDEPQEHCIILPSTTTERLFQLLANNPNGLIVHNEIASFLQKMSKSYNVDFKAEITDWFDTPEQIKRQTMQRRDLMRRPCFSISTASTKDWLLKEINPNDMHGGFMQRFLICSTEDIQREDINCRIEPGRTESRQTNNWLARLYAGLRMIGSIDHPKELFLSEEAINLHEQVNGDILDTIFEDSSNDLYSFWSRILTGYFIRLCIVFTLAEHVIQSHHLDVSPEENLQDMIVSEQTAAYALRLCHFFFQSIKLFIKKEVISGYNHSEQKVINVWHEHQDEIGKDQTITRKYMNVWSQLRKKDLDMALDNLVELGVVEESSFMAKDAKRPTTVYKLVIL